MDTYWNKLASLLTCRKTSGGVLNGETRLEQLYLVYAEEIGTDPPEVRTLFEQLETALTPAPAEMSKELDVLICRLCALHQKNAFLDGLALGFQLHSVLIENT